MNMMIEKRNYNEITAFVVGANTYRVIGTKHGMQQMRDRRLNGYHVASACLALGRKLDYYNNSGKHIMITDKGKDLSVVVVVEDYNIVIITVIDKSEVYVKNNTVTENFTFRVG